VRARVVMCRYGVMAAAFLQALLVGGCGNGLLTLGEPVYQTPRLDLEVVEEQQLHDRPTKNVQAPSHTARRDPPAAAARDPWEEQEIRHEVKRGETLSGISQHYYGTYGFYRALAAYNALDDPDRLSVGRIIRLPQDPRRLPPVPRETPPAKSPQRKPCVRGGPILSGNRPTPDPEPPRIMEANIPFACRPLMVEPPPVTAPALAEAHDLYQTRYREAQDSLRAGRYMEARDRFRACVALKSDFHPCRRGIALSEARFKDYHYRRGFLLYRQERLAEAVREWERVRALDPDYRGVGNLISKARRMLRRIETLKHSRKNARGFEAQPPSTL